MKTIKDKTRKMTVCSHYLQRKYSTGCEVPEIRLRGKWLMEAGFEVGNAVKITISEDGLMISVNKDADSCHLEA